VDIGPSSSGLDSSYPLDTGLKVNTSVSVCEGDGVQLAIWDSCPTPAESEAIEYLQVGPTEIRYSVAWTIFVYL